MTDTKNKNIIWLGVSVASRKFTNKKCLRSQYKTFLKYPYFIDNSISTSCTKCHTIARIKCESFLCCYNLCSSCKHTLDGCPICKNYRFKYIVYN